MKSKIKQNYHENIDQRHISNHLCMQATLNKHDTGINLYKHTSWSECHVFLLTPNRERFGGFQPSKALQVEERFNESWTQKHGTKSLNTHDHTWTLQGVPNGWERVPLSNLLGLNTTHWRVLVDFLSKSSSLQDLELPSPLRVKFTIPEEGMSWQRWLHTSCLPNSFESVIFKTFLALGYWRTEEPFPYPILHPWNLT